jgi:hypothetical protein
MRRLSILLLVLLLAGCSEHEIQIEIEGIPRAPGGPLYQWTSFNAFERFIKEKKLDEEGRIHIFNIPFGIAVSSKDYSLIELKAKAKKMMDDYIGDIESGRVDEGIRPKHGMPYIIKP